MTYTTFNGMDSEFRKDLVSGDWVLIASGRGKRPHAIIPRAHNYQSPADCPFEDLGQGPVSVIPNKFPAVTPGMCGPILERDGYQVTAGVGIHELVIMKDHDRQLHEFSPKEVVPVLQTYRDRYRAIAQTEGCGQYIMIFNNYGREGGASVYHPHSQIISVPILPPDVMRSLRGSYQYFQHHGVEAHAFMIAAELAARKRILFENGHFVAFCPFVSKQPYEVRIYPKFASARFDRLGDELLMPLGGVLATVLKKLHRNLNDPAYNFFIHTAPLHFDFNGGNGEENWDRYYRWHIEVIPRVSFDAGFEVGTGIKINIIDPDVAAGTLNG